MSSKRAHQKSRLGCGQCKKRRIKCDYQAPLCGPCRKKDLQCEFQVWEAAVERVQLLTPADFTKGQETSPRTESSQSLSGTEAFSLYDLGLLHDFTLHAFADIPRREAEDLQKVWQHEVPRLATSHGFLMHAILGFTAAYRTHGLRQNEPQYHHVFQSARYHYEKALIEMREDVKEVTAELADPFLCFSILICFVTLYFEAVDGSHPLDIVNSLFFTIRSTIGLLENDIVRAHLRQSKVGCLIRDADPAPKNEIPQDLAESLRWIHNSCPSESIDSTIFTTATWKLSHMYAYTTATPESWDFLLSWPISMVSEMAEFADALKQREPLALCILAHWIVPLCNAPPKWYVGEWPRSTFRTICSALAGTKWEEGLQWPMRHIQQQ